MAKNMFKITAAAFAAILSGIGCMADRLPAPGDEPVRLHTVSQIIDAARPERDSHTGEECWSAMQPMSGYSYILPHDMLTAGAPEDQRMAMYPRIKKMGNGEYIMFWHGSPTGSRIWSSISVDFKEWSEPVLLFSPEHVTVNGTGDWRRYVNMDAAVMPDGEILAVCSFRATEHYREGLGCGIMLIRSKDNGRTWTSPVQIYEGPNWEPYLLALPDGKLQCYFTDATPQTRNSGTSLIESSDNGITWSLRKRVCRQYKYRYDGPDGDFAGQKIYTDQMPCFRVLNDGKTLFGFIESRLERTPGVNGKSYYALSVIWNDSLEWKDLGEDSEGPSTRLSNVIEGGGGYVAVFPSGEVVISGHIGGRFRMKILDSSGCRNGGTVWDDGWLSPFSGMGYWSCTEVDSPLSLVAAMHCDKGIEFGRFYLNHCIDASDARIVADGDGGEWMSEDALYLGCRDGAESIFRTAKDDRNLYLLVETLSDDRSGRTRVDMLLGNPSGKDVKTVKISSSGSVLASDADISSSFRYGTSDKGESGFAVEIAIPLESLGLSEGDSLCLYSAMSDGGAVSTFSLSKKSDMDTWQHIKIR